ncbi:MAG: thioredoxin domain-containing protein [Chloroflexaceae bacterium]|nr:thioredoxin domain-containing protein [Chloroflexaceae bacterium]
MVETYVRPGQVLLVFRPVLNHGEQSLRTSEAAFCAAEQDQFWAMHDTLFARQSTVSATPVGDLPALLEAYAIELGMDVEAFRTCIASGEALALVQELDAEQRQRGITVQPIFEINEQRLIGLPSFDVFQRVIEETLSQSP